MTIRVVVSLNVHKIVTTSHGLLEHTNGSGSPLSKRGFCHAKWRTHYACQPSMKLVLNILIVGSSISISIELSTAGSHSFLNSRVTKIDFHGLMGMGSSGVRVTSRWTSPAFVDFLESLTLFKSRMWPLV